MHSMNDSTIAFFALVVFPVYLACGIYIALEIARTPETKRGFALTCIQFAFAPLTVLWHTLKSFAKYWNSLDDE